MPACLFLLMLWAFLDRLLLAQDGGSHLELEIGIVRRPGLINGRRLQADSRGSSVSVVGVGRFEIDARDLNGDLLRARLAAWTAFDSWERSLPCVMVSDRRRI